MKHRRVRSAFLALLVMLPLLLAACGGGQEGRAPQDSAAVTRGRDLYAQNCQQCHGDAATGTGRVSVAPSHGVDGHTWHHADGQLVAIVLGQLQYPGRKMPSFEGQLSEAEIRDILAYFKSIWGDEERAFQAEASRNWEEMYGS